MTAAQALTRIEAIQRKALVASAQVALAQVMPFVPIDTGALRESGKIIDNAPLKRKTLADVIKN